MKNAVRDESINIGCSYVSVQQPIDKSINTAIVVIVYVCPAVFKIKGNLADYLPFFEANW